MKRFRSIFLGYRIYRIKFLKIVGFVFLISAIVFLGVLAFLMNTWTSDLRQQTQNAFMERERKINDIRLWTMDYTNGLYENTKLMEDAAALFCARGLNEYIQKRRENSLGSSTQIGYLPASIKKVLLDNQNLITGVTLWSDEGQKDMWLEYGDIRLCFDQAELEDLATRRGDILAASYFVRNPGHMDQTLGEIGFWVKKRDIYEEDVVPASWALLNAEKEITLRSGAGREEERLTRQLTVDERQSGWFWGEKGGPVFFVRQDSEENDYSFLVMKNMGVILADNIYIVSVMVVAFVLVALGVLACYLAGFCSDAAFLSMIMDMLSSMESGNFSRMQEQTLPVRHRENEYEMIATALKDVGMKLKGYIETEYILKLKEQESQMRALQHQINPHFLYNTLEMLRSKALVHEDRDMADAIAMLGALYRARMHKADAISLKEEFAFLEMYLKIMALRFGDNFVYQIELEKEIGNISTINFWLQPLAENFFAHGFDRESEYNLLIVNGFAKEGGAEIVMIDNGCGADPLKLADIRRNMLEGNDEVEADIGLRNVYMRLNYFYGDGFSMEVENSVEGGFRVTVFIPAGSGSK